MFQGSTLKAKAGWLLLGLLLIGMSMLVVWSAPWQVATVQAQKTVTFIYSAKYVCAPDLGPTEPALVPGIYKTAVNVRNFLFDQEVKFTKKIVVSRGQDDPRGPISERETVTLKPDEAIDIDCPDIVKLLKSQRALSPKGFVVIESPVELEVVAVYTSELLVKDTSSDFTCWNKILYFDIPIEIRREPAPIGQVEYPLPNKVSEIVLPCPPPPKTVNIPAGGRDEQNVPEGVDQVVVVNPPGNPPLNTPAGGVPPNGSRAIPVTPGQRIIIGNPGPGPANGVRKIYQINDLQAHVRILLGMPAGNIFVAKKIVETDRSNKVIGIFKTPPGREYLAPVPPGRLFEIILPPPLEGVPLNVTEAVRASINEGLKKAGKPPLPPDVTIEIIHMEYGVGTGLASVGPEVEMGIGQGVGVGVGAGISIDVEYIQPKRVER
jgi:hypothetical protein